MNGGDPIINDAIERMLFELEYQATISCSMHFIYTFQESDRRIGKLLSKDEQLKMLWLLDSKKLIAMGINVFSESDEDKYWVEIELGTYEKWIENTKSKNNLDLKYEATLIYEDNELSIYIKNESKITLQGCHQDSKVDRLFRALFNNPPGVALIYSNIFPLDKTKNFRRIFNGAKLDYLLPIFFDETKVSEIKLRKMPVKITGELRELILSKK